MIHGYRVVTLFKCINCNQLLVSKSITRLIPPSNLPGRGGWLFAHVASPRHDSVASLSPAPLSNLVSGWSNSVVQGPSP